MSDYFAVDPDGLAKNAPNVRAFADQVLATHTRLTSLDSLGECWGDDPMGRYFAKIYLDAKKEMLTGISGLVDVLHSTSDGLVTMAKGFHQVEETNIAHTRKIAGPPPRPRL